MAKPSTRRLKVFQAQLGFYETVVAAPSQAAALLAWGVHQNLFAAGEARIAEDAHAVQAALSNPLTPLLRAIGSKDAFALEAVSLPEVPDTPKIQKAKSTPKAARKAASKPFADRSALDLAEAALLKLDKARKAEEAELRTRKETLDAQTQAAQARYVDQRRSVAVKIKEALQAYRAAGGTD